MLPPSLSRLRLWLCILLSSLASVPPAFAAETDALKVLPPLVDGVAPESLVDAQLKKLAFAALDQREADYERMKTADDVAAWQKRRREIFLDALGGFPDRTPLNARVTGVRDLGDYRIEKIIFESQPGFFVTGLLYLPAEVGPHPGVLMPCGHTGIAKAGALYQRAAISMAKAGLATFCYDPIGQGERRQYRKPDGAPEFPSSTMEHQLMGVGATLLGMNLARTMIWDGMRALDYLQARPEIIGDRLGCTGVSGGGTLTSYLMALDDRVTAAAPACYLTGFRRLLETIGPQDAEQQLYNQIGAGLDHADYVLLRAPRPTLVMAATQDFFDISGAWNLFRQSKRIYSRLGFSERVELIEADTKHDLGLEMREASARWFRRWLTGRDDAWKEPVFDVLPESEVLCTAEGDVFRQAGARTYFDLNAEMEARLAPVRRQFWSSSPPAEALTKVRELARVRLLAGIPSLKMETVGTSQRDGVRLDRIIFHNAEGTVIPALCFQPERSSGVTRLYVHGDGKQADAAPGGRIDALVRAGETVVAIDVRGAGETEPKTGASASSSLIGRYPAVVATADLIGRSLVGMRTEDILACARGVRETFGHGQTIQLTGIGEAGVPALHAAALEPALFAAVRLERTLQSWSGVVRAPHARNQQINAVHGALRFYDLPDLVSALPAGKLEIHEPVDAEGVVKQ